MNSSSKHPFSVVNLLASFQKMYSTCPGGDIAAFLNHQQDDPQKKYIKITPMDGRIVGKTVEIVFSRDSWG